MSKVIKNITASVHARLLDQARRDKRPFNELLQYFAMDRLLYRWSESAHSKSFILKGALMLRVWHASETRPTRDIDMLGTTRNDESMILHMIRDVNQTKVESDGLEFDGDLATIERITEHADYHGLRITFKGYLGNAEIPMQIDIGFGDIVYPAAQPTELPPMLGFPAGKLLCYSRESAIAEKFEAAVSLGILNSRMKDFFDIWTLSRQFDFESTQLAEAIRLTFNQRRCEIPGNLSAFSAEFIMQKQPQWSAFRRRLSSEHVPESFGGIVNSIDEFLSPILTQTETKATATKWRAPGPWQ